MKNWLKFFGLSFFSDKIAKESAKRSAWNFLLGFILAIVLLFCGSISADMLPFKTHYNNASDFKSFVYTVFANEDSDKRLNVNIKDGTALAAVGNDIYSVGRLIDTYTNESDSKVYGVNGYNLIVDTHPANAFDAFEAYCISNDGKEQEITYEEYLGLSSAAKYNFDFKIRYTAEELVLTDELTTKHEEFLDALTADDNVEIHKSYKELKGRKDVTEEEYAKSVYALYVRAYYPDLSAYESTSYVPLLRNYYYHNFLNKGENYIAIFDDSCVMSFKTDAGIQIVFYGFYDKLDGITDTHLLSVAEAQKNSDDFIYKTFSSNSTFKVYVYMLSLARQLLILVIIPLLLALATYFVLKLMGAEWCKRYGTGLKLVGSFMWFAALITAFITFVCGFFISRNMISVLAMGLFLVILVIRIAVLLALEKVNLKKKVAAVSTEEQTADYLTANESTDDKN